MSIPTPFNPLGSPGGGWKEVDMSSFTADNWNDLSAMTPPGLVPCGLPNALIFNVRECMRSRSLCMLFFGYSNQSTRAVATYSYNRGVVPPRNHTDLWGAPALEFWNLGVPVAIKLTFTLTPSPTEAFATRDDWEDSTDYEEIQISEKEAGVYECETTFAARSIIINGLRGSVSGQITKIFTKQ